MSPFPAGFFDFCMLMALCAGQMIAGLFVRPRYGRPLRQLLKRRRRRG